MSDHATLAIGYRILDVDYEQGSGSERFKYDLTTQGFATGFLWTF